jgi:hypothetical protein
MKKTKAWKEKVLLLSEVTSTAALHGNDRGRAIIVTFNRELVMLQLKVLFDLSYVD